MKRRLLLALSGFTAAFGISSTASAQPVQAGYAVNNFEPSERGSDWFANDSLDLRGHFRFAIGAVGDFGYRGVIGAYHPDGTVIASVLRNQVFVNAGASMVVWDRLRLGLNLPIQVFADGHVATVDGIRYAPPQNEQSVGDLRISADLRLLGVYGEPFTLAAGASVFAPIGQRDSYTGDNVARLSPHLLMAGDAGSIAYSARLGYLWRDLNVDYIDSRVGSTIQFGGAVGVRVLDKKLLVGPELFGQTNVSNSHAFEQHATPIEIMLGSHLNVADQLKLGAGAGTFITKGYGAPVFRTLFSIEWAPGVEKSDRDKDGIADDVDACPDVAGVATNDPKTNGCPPPPPDRDHDGILDLEDACPDVAGVRTDDPKTNGCPPDRDHDTILDGEDACPDVAGVRTDDPKTNGCPPDLDRDKDGIQNDVDACPDVPGPKSDDPKTSGCPRVFIKNSQIQILEQPKFDFNKAAIKPESDSLLAEVAKAMADHPEIKHVRVEGHTDSVGSAVYNKKLSGQRAQSVVKWLTGHGVPADHLSAVGMGKEKPLVPNDTEAQRAINRRVEFHIEEQDTTSKEVVKTPGGAMVPAPPATKSVPEGAAPTPKKYLPK